MTSVKLILATMEKIQYVYILLSSCNYLQGLNLKGIDMRVRQPQMIKKNKRDRTLRIVKINCKNDNFDAIVLAGNTTVIPRIQNVESLSQNVFSQYQMVKDCEQQ